MKLGVLALQGAFREHVEAFAALDVRAVLVRRPEELAALDAIVLPGGESTTQDKLLTSSGLREPLVGALRDGMACLATCAGLILVASEVLDGRADQAPLGLLDASVRRNGYGRQVDSFEAPLAISPTAGDPFAASSPQASPSPFPRPFPRPFPGVFIRAPKIERVGDIEVLAEHEGAPVLVRAGAIWGATFHPELSRDLRLHEAFLAFRT